MLGVLVDVSDDGFRARHSDSCFQANDSVRFLHQLREGIARVVWTQGTTGEFETGFEYLDVDKQW